MLPANFDPSDPQLWERRCYAYDAQMEPDGNITDLGFTREELIGLVLFRQLRAEVVKKGLSLFITVDGRHRSGKSRFIAVLGSLFSEEFKENLKKFIVSDANSLLNLVEEIDAKKILNPFIMVDEAGSAMNSADWYERIQKAIIKTMTIIGYLHPTIVFLAPIKDLILSGIRKMSHIHLKITRSNNNYACVVPYNVHYNSFRGKPFFSKFKLNIFGMPIRLNSLRVSLPPKELDAAYSAIELERKPIMLREIRNDAVKAAIKEKRDVLDYEEISDFIVKNPKLFESEKSRPDALKFNSNLVKAKFRCSVRDAQTIQVIAERKARGGAIDVQKGASGKQ